MSLSSIKGWVLNRVFQVLRFGSGIFRSLSRKGSGVPPDRVGLLGAFLSGSPGNGPDLVRVHAKFFLCASHSAMTVEHNDSYRMGI
jgi:hypothetical protein